MPFVAYSGQGRLEQLTRQQPIGGWGPPPMEGGPAAGGRAARMVQGSVDGLDNVNFTSLANSMINTAVDIRASRGGRWGQVRAVRSLRNGGGYVSPDTPQDMGHGFDENGFPREVIKQASLKDSRSVTMEDLASADTGPTGRKGSFYHPPQHDELEPF